MTDDSQIKCVILTLRRENVILPNALVAEIVSVKGIEQSENTPDWYLGMTSWRGSEVPLLSFEAADGLEKNKVNLNTQAVILYAVGNEGEVSEHPYMGLVMSGVPHVNHFSREQFRVDNEASSEHPMVAQKIRINGASLSILDVDAMVEMVSELAA